MLNKVVDWFEKQNNQNKIIVPEDSNHDSIFDFFQPHENVVENNDIEDNNDAGDIATLMQAESAESMVWRGIKLEQKNNFEEAIKCYRQAVKLNTQSASAHHILAVALRKQNKLTEANYHHQQAVSLEKNSENQPNQLHLGNLNQKTDSEVEKHSKNQLELKTDSHNGDVVIFPKLTTIAPGKDVESTEFEIAKIFLQQARLYFAEHRWQKTIDACKDALKACPDIAEIYKLYGNSLQKLGETAEAIGLYAKALAVDPNYAEVYANIGNIYAQQEQWNEAIDYYQKALKVNPELAKAYVYLSRVWEKIGQQENALNCLIQGLKYEPEILTLQQYLQLADKLLAEGKIDLALTCCEHAVKLHPNSKVAYQKIIKVLEQKGEWQKATIYYQGIIEILENSEEPKELSKSAEKRRIIESLFKDTSNNLAKQRYLLPSQDSNNSLSISSTAFVKNQQKQKLDLAINHLVTKLQQEPNSSSIRLQLGKLFAQKQKWKQAIICYRQAIRIDPKLAIAYIKLGKIYGILGKNIEAAKLVFRGYSLQPKAISPEEHYKLGNYFVKHQENHLAISCYRHAIQLKPGFSEAHNQLQKIINAGVNKQLLIESSNL